MSPSEATAPPPLAPAAAQKPALHTNPYVGILGVLLGAALATLNLRLLSVGLPDLRGAKGLGIDEASWIPTALNMAAMFSGVFVAFVNARFGPRRILFPLASIFAIVSAILPFMPGYWPMIALIVIAGLSSGTFYTLTLTFALTALPKRLIIYGLAAYAAEIVFVSNVAALLEGWYLEHLSWRWIFWTAAVGTPLMIVCIYFGIPRRPPSGPMPSWRGFTYFSASLALIYGALDQAERLDWLNSGVIVGMLAGGIVLFAAACIQRLAQPNPILKLSFLNNRNTIILAFSIFIFRFVLLSTLILTPGFLSTIQGYRSLQVGHALAWVALPMFATVWLIAALIIFTNSRLMLAFGLTLVAVACWTCSRVDSAWAGNNFQLVELLLALGFAGAFVGLVASIVLQAVESGVLSAAENAATFAGFMHFIRLFGGEVGVAVMSRVITVRERYHSNLLGLHVQDGIWQTEERVRALTAGLFASSTGLDEANSRAIGVLNQQVRAQAYTMAISDGFILIAWTVVFTLLLLLFLRPLKYSYKDLRKMK